MLLRLWAIAACVSCFRGFEDTFATKYSGTGAEASFAQSIPSMRFDCCLGCSDGISMIHNADLPRCARSARNIAPFNFHNEWAKPTRSPHPARTSGISFAVHFSFTSMVPEDAGCSAVAGCPDVG